MNFFSVLFMLVVYLLNKIHGKILDEQVNVNTNSISLTKFSFHSHDGYIFIQSTDKFGQFYLLNRNEWKNDLANICSKNELKLIQNSNQTNIWSLSTSFTDTNRQYLILSLCKSNRTNVNLSYKIILTNGKDLFTEHFSNDERGILGLYLASTIVYMIFLFVFLRSMYFSKRKSFLIIRLSIVSVICSWLNSLLSLILNLIFAFTGSNQIFIYQFCLFFSRLFGFTAQILFLLILILCVKGYLILQIHLKKSTLIEIQLFIILYTILQIIILILLTITASQLIANENLLMTCNYLQMIMYLLTWIWFVVSFFLTSKNSMAKFYYFLIFSIWFLINAIVVLLMNFDVVVNPRITILKTIQISIQLLAYCFFEFIIQSKTFFIRTKLNQINITYIDPSSSKVPITTEHQIVNRSNELTNLCFVENSWTSKFRMQRNLNEPLPRLEPRRELSSQLTQTVFPGRISQLKENSSIFY